MNYLNSLAILLIRTYKFLISPFLTPCCRFTPTCSQYAEEAFQKKGFLRGFFLTIKRIFKCHPFHHGGFDPVV